MGDVSRRPQGRRRPRRKGRAIKDAERRALAKAHAQPARPVKPARPGFAVLQVDGGARGAPGLAAIGYVVDDERGAALEAEITDRRMRIGTVVFEWIPANANGAAHELVARALESAEG